MCVSTYVHGRCMGPRMYLWRLEVNMGCRPQLLSILKQSLALKLELTNWLRWLASDPPVTLQDPPISIFVSMCHHDQLFYLGSGNRTHVFTLARRAFDQLSSLHTHALPLLRTFVITSCPLNNSR